MPEPKKGITLIELIIVIILFILLSGFFLWTFSVGLKMWDSGRRRAEIRQSGALAIERMVRELSQASSFTIAQAEQVKFDADLDNDGSDETVTLSISGSELMWEAGAAEMVLASSVQNLAFSYRDLNNTAMAFPITGNERDDIRVVIIALTLSDEDETVILSSGVYTRNQGL